MTENKLTQTFSINVDETTAQLINKLAEYYQRKPRELLRLLLIPVLSNKWAEVQTLQHPENITKPTPATFTRFLP